VQIPAAMVFRHARKIVSGFEPVPTADSRLLDRFARATAFGRSGGGPIDGCRGNMLVHGIPIRLCAWAGQPPIAPVRLCNLCAVGSSKCMVAISAGSAPASPKEVIAHAISSGPPGSYRKRRSGSQSPIILI